jgi:hypothetical protein
VFLNKQCSTVRKFVLHIKLLLIVILLISTKNIFLVDCLQEKKEVSKSVFLNLLEMKIRRGWAVLY